LIHYSAYFFDFNIFNKEILQRLNSAGRDTSTGGASFTNTVEQGLEFIDFRAGVLFPQGADLLGTPETY
jgi:hypothetical protein